MIEPEDRGLLLGDGLFETLRVEGGRPLLLGRHLARLAAAAEVLRLRVPFDAVQAGIEEAIASLAPGQAGSMRITVTRGPGPRGLVPPADPRPATLVTAAPSGFRTNSVIAAQIARTRRNAGSAAGQMKTLCYADNILARMEASADASDAIMLNTDGWPACTTIGNLLAWTPDGWVTPPLELGGILPGVVRGVLIESGQLREAPIAEEDLLRFPLARSNSLAGVQPLVIPGGAPPVPAATAELTATLEAVERREQ